MRVFQRLFQGEAFRLPLFILSVIGIPVLFVSGMLFDPVLLLHILAFIIMSGGLLFFIVVFFSSAWEAFKTKEPFYIVFLLILFASIVIGGLVYLVELFITEWPM